MSTAVIARACGAGCSVRSIDAPPARGKSPDVTRLELSDEERREFFARFAALRERTAETLEHGWVSEYDSHAAHATATQRKSAGRNG